MATLRQIQETLSQSNGAQFLYQPTIDRALITLLRRFTATRMIIPRRTWNMPKYIFNKRSNYPVTQATVEAPPTSATGYVVPSSSTYAQVSYNVKHWQVNMDLAKFSIQTARVNGDLMALELQAASEGAVWFEEALNFYGSGGATLNTWRPQYDGMDLLMTASNKIVANATPTIALLDAMIDNVKRAIGSSLVGKYCFVLSPEMHSAFSRIFVQFERWMGNTTIYPRDDRGQINGVVSDNINYPDAGVEVPTYRGIPFYESSFLTSLGTMSTVTAASPTGTDGVIAAGTYYYAFEVVTDFGISVAYETTQVTISATNHVAFTWTAPTITDALGNTRQNLLYRIYRTAKNGAAGTETLYAVMSAQDVATSSDSAITGWTDTGAISDSTTSTSINFVTVASASSVALPDGFTSPRMDTTSGHTAQDIFLIPRDPDIMVQAVVNEMQTVPLALVNARTQQVALIGDQVLAVRGPGFMSKANSVYVA
jgi:hypothetical protein